MLVYHFGISLPQRARPVKPSDPIPIFSDIERESDNYG